MPVAVVGPVAPDAAGVPLVPAAPEVLPAVASVPAGVAPPLAGAPSVVAGVPRPPGVAAPVGAAGVVEPDMPCDCEPASAPRPEVGRPVSGSPKKPVGVVLF